MIQRTGDYEHATGETRQLQRFTHKVEVLEPGAALDAEVSEAKNTPLRPYSTEIALAMELLREMRAMGGENGDYASNLQVRFDGVCVCQLFRTQVNQSHEQRRDGYGTTEAAAVAACYLANAKRPLSAKVKRVQVQSEKREPVLAAAAGRVLGLVPEMPSIIEVPEEPYGEVIEVQTL